MLLEFYLELEFLFYGVVSLDCLATLKIWMLVSDKTH